MTNNLTVSDVRLANVVPGAVPVEAGDKGVNETFIGLIRTSSDQLRAYIKVVDARQLVNELVCSTVGRSVGLSVPEGFLVRASSSDLPESTMLAQHNGEALIFASADVGRPSLKRRLSDNGPEFLRSLFSTWDTWDVASIFDEWIANPDRHTGNLLIEGPDKVWLIDHSHAFTGPAWTIADLLPDRVVQNKLADYCFPNLTLPERMAVRMKAAKLSNAFSMVQADAVLVASHATKLLDQSEAEALRAFVNERVSKLFGLISARLGIPNLGV